MELTAVFTAEPVALVPDFSRSYWQAAPAYQIGFLWDGTVAPPALQTTAKILWTREAIIFGYECAYTELDMDESFDLSQERHALWDRDVCEAFVRSPLETDPRIYKEFEVAPTGQWVDLQINRITVVHDWEWKSGMKTAAVIEPQQKTWRAVMSVPFTAFGIVPQNNECWAANLFRVSRLQGVRQFMAYAPTLTPTPSFHVPEKFVSLRFAQ